MYPPHRPVSTSEAREADRLAASQHGLPSLVLMEHAGRGLALLAAQHRPRDLPVAVLCGPGNNGGDGYACARFLLGWGVPTRVVRVARQPPREGDAALEHALVSREAPVAVVAAEGDAPALARALEGAGLVVDALFGIGLARPLAPPFPAWIEAVNAADAFRLAADVPSGIDADSGLAMPVAVRAHATAAMGFVKRGCVTAAGAAYAGRLVEVDIGLPGAIHRAYLA